MPRIARPSAAWLVIVPPNTIQHGGGTGSLFIGCEGARLTFEAATQAGSFPNLPVDADP